MRVNYQIQIGNFWLGNYWNNIGLMVVADENKANNYTEDELHEITNELEKNKINFKVFKTETNKKSLD